MSAGLYHWPFTALVFTRMYWKWDDGKPIVLWRIRRADAEINWHYTGSSSFMLP